MQVFAHTEELQDAIQNQKNKNHIIGFVPTMGALHQGHISLVKRAVSENETTVVSIFINPTQFDNADDLERYPQSLESDIALLKEVSKELIVFAPTASEIYSGNIKSDSYDFDGLDKVMEGEFRDGHFEGVATIVEIFLRTVNPDRAYFGEKDFQQLQIIKKLVEIKDISCEIIGCPIERETGGLAMSSRNERLSKSVRANAGFIYKTLKTAKTKFGIESAITIKDWVKKEFHKNHDFTLEYFEITDIDTLTPMLKKQENRKYRAFIAVYAEKVRLIDNIALN